MGQNHLANVGGSGAGLRVHQAVEDFRLSASSAVKHSAVHASGDPKRLSLEGGANEDAHMEETPDVLVARRTQPHD